ncbi:hypothetical protein M569_02611 [Genlisea aurea]|uniref:Uncharacterized protein n=1 Tax=Genlisea aurea TaxID=192259 RepID=S8D425_9LAMI|nr:hypothetical protein M569_02611 [Genlisea aurea]
MNRTMRDSVFGGVRNIPLGHRRGLSINGAPNSLLHDPVDEKLDLFSANRRSLSVASSDESDVSMKLGKLSLGSVKQPKNGSDDLLSSEGGKHDYDWLLTPPGTPLVSSSNRNESQTTVVAARGAPVVRSISAAKASRFSVSSENNHAVKPARSSSVTRPAPSTSHYSTYSNKSSAILNTSSSSVSSYIRPATPTSRSSISKPSTPSARPSVSRSSTPSKLRPAASPSSVALDKPRPSVSSRPSTPTTSRSQNGPSTTTRIASSRPSTPTSRRNSAPSSSSSVPAAGVPSTPGGRSLSNGRSISSVSRPSSPSPRVRPPPQPPILLVDLPMETPPNLRTSLPDRPLSAGRSRPGVAAKRNEDHHHHQVVPKRQASPVGSRGRIAEPAPAALRARGGQDGWESRRESATQQRPAENGGFGRTISKKSLDVAIRHMDIRNGVRAAVTGTNVFPHSIRQKKSNGNGNGNGISEEENKCSSSDAYESCRYDMFLLKEDVNNTNWLHSIDDAKTDQELLLFDSGFGVVPEPFSPL